MQHRRRSSADAGIGHRRNNSSGGGVDGAPQYSPPHGPPLSQILHVLVEATETGGDNAPLLKVDFPSSDCPLSAL